MLRVLGIGCSALIVASVALPWASGPQIGIWSPFDLVKNAHFSHIDLSQIKDFLSSPLNGDPVNATPWAVLAFAISFPLAAIFAFLGVFGYFSKAMGLFLGAVPMAIAAFTYYALRRATAAAPAGFDMISAAREVMQTHHVAFGWGLPAYLGSAVLLFLTAVFTKPSHRV